MLLFSLNKLSIGFGLIVLKKMCLYCGHVVFDFKFSKFVFYFEFAGLVFEF